MYLGQMTALSLLQDGPGLPIFADGVVRHVLNMSQDGANMEDLPTYLVDKIKEMNQTSTHEALQLLYGEVIEECQTAGFLVPSTRFISSHIPIMTAALVQNMVTSCQQELQQFIEGLKTHQVMDLLRSDPENSVPLLSGRVKEVTASVVREHLNFRYREGNLGELDRETGQGFLTFLQATKGKSTILNGIDIKPKDVLMWLTGATLVPATGFHKKIDVEFGEACKVNTCALVVTLAKVPNHTEDIVQFYTELVINSQTFQTQ